MMTYCRPVDAGADGDPIIRQRCRGRPPRLSEARAHAGEGPVPVRTILTLLQDSGPPQETTAFDRALVADIYNASRNYSAPRVYSYIVASAARLEVEGKGSAK